MQPGRLEESVGLAGREAQLAEAEQPAEGAMAMAVVIAVAVAGRRARVEAVASVGMPAERVAPRAGRSRHLPGARREVRSEHCAVEPCGMRAPRSLFERMPPTYSPRRACT